MKIVIHRMKMESQCLFNEIWNNCQVHKGIVITQTLQYIKQLILW